MGNRELARSLARTHLSGGDPLGWFERLYAAASNDPGAIPWADLRPNVNLRRWLDEQAAVPHGTALVVGCGLGDDAEELSRRGLDVTAFDISATAVRWCGTRFPASAVTYVAADLLAPPAAWEGAFDFVLESYTLQVLPPELRERAMRSLAGFLAADGELLLICRGREPGEPEGQMPWPLTRAELSGLAEGAGLGERVFEDFFDEETPPVRRFRVLYGRAAGRVSA